MNTQNITPNSTERWTIARLIRLNGIVEIYSDYMVSDTGRVASMKRKVMKILKPARIKDGYLQVGLCVDGKQYLRQVHRVVISSFQPELWSMDNNEVDHLDRNVTNNRLSNLRWADRNVNCANRDKCPLKRIRVTHLDDGHTEEFDNMKDCSRTFGRSHAWCEAVIRKYNGFHEGLNILIEKI